MTAYKAGDNNYNQSAASASFPVTLHKAAQAALTLNASSPLSYTASEALSTTGGSGTGAVTFSLTSGSCSLSTNQLTANSGTGSCVAGATKAADNNYNQATASATVTLQALATGTTVTYTGLEDWATASASISTVPVTSSATVAVGAGDITTAKVAFSLSATGSPALCAANIGRISGTVGGTQTGSASCTWTGSAGNTLPGQSYTVYAVLGGNYGGASDDDSINVHYPATSNTMTGGGYIVATAEAGAYAGKAGSKTNFGVNVKYNKSGANLQGNVNIIVRNGTTMYQFKSNSLTQLSVTLDTNANPLSGTCAATLPYSCATFISKGSGQMWQTTNPSAVTSLGGNWTIQVQMHDVADPGTGKDSIGITVWDNSGAIVFSSNWSNGTTGEQTIGGGNLQVH